jgi:hypothetical protein
MLEKISKWTERKFAPGSRPEPKTVVGWIKSGIYYGEQIGGCWYIDESVSVAKRPADPPSTGNDVADSILRSVGHG